MNAYYRIVLGSTSCYLLPLSEGYLMVDCGSEDNAKQLLLQLRKHRIPISSIRYLFLTHHHGDHSGLLRFLCSENPQLKVILSRACAEYLMTGHNQEVSEHYATPALKYAFWLFAKLGFKMKKTFPVYVLRSGDIIIDREEFDLAPFVGSSMIALASPGHTPDSITLIYNRYAFVGDSARNLLNLLGSPYEPICQDDPAACQESLRKLMHSKYLKIYPGHGSSFSPTLLVKRSSSYHLNG